MVINLKRLAVSVLLPLAVGGAAGLITRGSVERYADIAKPPLSPPGWLFPVVWTILFLLMGIASYLVFTSKESRDAVNTALLVYGIQLVVNFFWSIFFFNFGAYLFSFFWLILLWVLILAVLLLFGRISKAAGYLMLPYLLWVSFAGYLNLAIYLIN